MKNFLLGASLVLSFFATWLAIQNGKGYSENLTKFYELEYQGKLFEGRITDLEKTTSTVSAIARSMVVEPTDEAYRYVAIDDGLMSLAVSVQNVKEYAGGSKLEISFGNPYLATINAVTFKVSWSNKKGEKGEKEGKSLQDFQPGKWNKVSVSIPVAPADLKYVSVSDIDSSSIALNR